ncbi:HEPN domain-containing protein [Actinomycetospora sp. CA-053990]|uniref:ApeA N-terminal domain 1-containing protein n=1 Tax=Actinomycetospora sp. CA-053990 TaxID=3239891 RepID=UPI003D923D0D
MLLDESGTWWLPEASQDEVPGLLSMEGNDDPTLRLIGGFDRRVFHQREGGGLMSFGELRPMDCVHGESFGKPISLLGCSVTSMKSGLLGPPIEQVVRPSVAVVGVYVDSLKDEVIDAVEVCLENLTQWSGSSAFTGSIEFSPDEGPTGRQTIEVEPVEQVECSVGTVKFALKHRHTALRYDDERARRTARVKEYTVLRIEFGNPVDFRTCDRYIADIQDLLTLCVDSPCAILNETIFVRTSSGEEQGSSRGARRGDVFRRYVVTPNPDAESVESHEMLATLDAVSFTQLVPRWFELIERVRSSVRMVTGLSYIRGGYLETRLVTAVSAAEGLHRSLYAGEAMAEEDFQELRRVALDGLKPSQAQWLRDRLRNETALNDRLLDMARRAENLLGSPPLPDVAFWASEAKRARNALVHRDETGRPARQLRRMSLHKLDAIVEGTLLIVTLLLFVELRLPEDAFTALPGKNRRLTAARDLATKHLTETS